MTRHPVTPESRACRILSAALAEHASGLLRTRWALDEVLSDNAKAFLEDVSAKLLSRGVESENEAWKREYPATLPPEAPSGDAPDGKGGT